jgi:hypothetical protein
MASPIPAVEPVTSARLPDSCKSMRFFLGLSETDHP